MFGQRKRLFLFLFLFLIVAFCVSFFGSSLLGNSSSFGVVKGAKLVWERNYGGVGDDRCFSAVAAEAGYVLAGSSTSFGGDETVGWVVRVDEDGKELWNWTFKEGFGTEFRQVLNLEDGFLLLGNIFFDSGETSGLAVKLDKEGAVQWSTTLIACDGVNKLFAVAKSVDGFLLAGLVESSEGGDSHVWVVKLGFDGVLLWNKVYSDLCDSAGRGVAVTQDGYCVVAGYIDTLGSGNYDFLVLKLDSSGTVLWNRTYGGGESDKAYALALAFDGYVIVGDTRSKGAGDSDVWIVKVDFDGNLVWETPFGGGDFDAPTCVVQLSGDKYLVSGVTFSYGNGLRDFLLLNVDSSGQVVWSCTAGRSNYEEAYAVVPCASGEFLMVGWTSSLGQGRYDFYAVKVKTT
ncbi:MAG: hypothetical protein N3D85_04970 [Candidatus Bathyarchaeota archaeon]|nr:hypothetical protein [Candidatus Bathyarchaeota archaeon]